MYDWQDDARCRGLAVELFYEKEHEKWAVAFCQRCPVLDECRSFADHTESIMFGAYGVFGGESPDTRKRRRHGEKKSDKSGQLTMLPLPA